MLENVSKTKLHSYLATGVSVTATSTTYIDSGLSIVLAPNSTYYITSATANTSNGDGIRLKYLYSGTIVDGRLFYGTAAAECAVGDEIISTTVDGIVFVTGIIRTGTAGKFYIQFAKYTDVGTDTPIIPGSYLVAIPL